MYPIMRSLYVAVILIIAWIQFGGIAHIQAQRLPDPIRGWTINDGLPSNNLTDIFEDSKNYLWIGTKNGLSRFDGKEFEQFIDQANLKNRLIGDVVKNVFEDTEGNIWVINYGGGISRYSYNNPEYGFQQIYGPAYFPTMKSTGNAALFLHIDKEYIYLRYNDSIKRYSIKKQEIIHWKPLQKYPDFDSISYAYCKPIRYCPDRAAVFDSHVGFAIFQVSSGELVFKLSDSLRREITESPGFLRFNIIDPYLLIFSDIGAYWMFDWQKKILLYKGFIQVPENQKIQTAGPLKDGSFIYIINRKSLNRYFPKTNQNLDQSHFLVQKDGTLSVFRGIIESKGPLTWLMTLNGLILWDIEGSKIANYKIPVFASNNAAESRIHSFHNLQNGNVIIHSGNRLLRLELSSDQFQKLDLKYNGKDLNITAVFSNSNQIVVFADQKIFSLQADGKTVLKNHLIGKADVLQNFQSSKLICGFHDTTGGKSKWWFGAGTEGLFIWNPQTQYLEKFQWPDSISNVNIFAISKDRFGHIIIYSRTNGLLGIDPIRQILNFRLPISGTSGGPLSTGKVMSLVQDSKKSIWLVQQPYGLVHVIQNPGCPPEIEILGKAKGLNNNLVFSGNSDEQGNIWIGSQSGIEKWDIQKQRFFHFGPEYGILDNQFIEQSGKTNNGDILLSSGSGFIKFNPNKLEPNRRLSSVYLAQWLVNSKTRNDLLVTKKVQLSYKENNLTFKFKTIEYKYPARNLFRYKLIKKGQDLVNWNYTDRPEVHFPGLEAGLYTLLYNLSNDQEIWHPSDFEIIFEIKNAWYYSWWFICLSGIMVSLVLYGLYR